VHGPDAGAPAVAAVATGACNAVAVEAVAPADQVAVEGEPQQSLWCNQAFIS
jgi:hypothetical protein